MQLVRKLLLLALFLVSVATFAFADKQALSSLKGRLHARQPQVQNHEAARSLAAEPLICRPHPG